MPRCPHCFGALAMGAPCRPGFEAPSAVPRPLPPRPELGAPPPAVASCGLPGQRWARVPRRVFQAPGRRAGTGKRGGGEERAGALWAAGGIPGSAQTGPGAARCEMRLVERPGQRAGGGRRTASVSRRPPAPGARKLCPPCLSEQPRQALSGHLRWPFCLLPDCPFVSLLISPNLSVSLPASLPLSLCIWCLCMWCLYAFLALSLGGGYKPGGVGEWMSKGREDLSFDSFLQGTADVGSCGGSSHGPGISSHIL